MRFRRSCSLAVTARPARGGAAPPRSRRRPTLGAHLQRGQQPRETRSATFYGRMRAMPGTAPMQMRFTLLDRFGDGDAARDQVPGSCAVAPLAAGRQGVRLRARRSPDFRPAARTRGGRVPLARRGRARCCARSGATLGATAARTATCRTCASWASSRRGARPEGTEIYYIEVANPAASGARLRRRALRRRRRARTRAHRRARARARRATVSLHRPDLPRAAARRRRPARRDPRDDRATTTPSVRAARAPALNASRRARTTADRWPR